MPFPVPTSWPDPGPRTSAGDIKIFSEKRIVWGIGVADPSHMTDLSKARSSGDEFSAEIFKRMVEPYGWTVDIVYFNSNYTYHLDCLLAPRKRRPAVLSQGLAVDAATPVAPKLGGHRRES